MNDNKVVWGTSLEAVLWTHGSAGEATLTGAQQALSRRARGTSSGVQVVPPDNSNSNGNGNGNSTNSSN